MPKIVVEIGLNHLGSEGRALRALESALKTPIDAVTFQIREKSYYNKRKNTAPLSNEFYKKAAKITRDTGKAFGMAICDIDVIDFFTEINVDFWKTLSWDLGNEGLQGRLQKTGKKTYISTGISGMDDILNVAKKYKNIVFIHTQLSQNIEDVNLKAIRTIREITFLPVAFGLHCGNKDVLKVSLAYEPEAIFFYVKESNLPSLPDDDHAVDINDIENTVKELRSLEKTIGTGTKAAAEMPGWIIK